MADTEKKAFKNWFDRKAAKQLALQIESVHGDFESKKFVRLCCSKLDTLEFHGRVQQFSSAMHETLPDSYPRAIKILEKSLPTPLPDTEAVTDGWLQWPVGQFIADHGLLHFKESMQCMVKLTQRFSAEFAVRPFVQDRPEETFEYLYSQLEHKSPHVRRWCSEGSRTRLPWGAKLHSLIADPTPVLAILEALKDDVSVYVRKSVANNLNDLSKDHPGLVIDLCSRWSTHSTPQRDWIIKQGLRGLIKAGDKKALKLIGFASPANIDAKIVLAENTLAIGNSVAMSTTLRNNSKRKQNLLIDYIVHYQGKSSAKRSKVFKWKTVEIKAGEKIVLAKKHPMKITTIRALYPGKHKIELQLNGDIVASCKFELTK